MIPDNQISILLLGVIKSIPPMLPLFALLAAMALLVKLIDAPVVKGFIAEFIVNILLHVKLPRDEYTIYWNVTLPTPNGTTQIDHIVVSPYGIFVIETKAYGGWIFGDRHQKQWTQTFFRKKYRFQNPLHQNYKHTQVVQAITGMDAEIVYSIVAFSGLTMLKTKDIDNVLYLIDLPKYILSRNLAILSAAEVISANRLLADFRLKPNLKTHAEHVRHVQDLVAGKQQSQGETDAPKSPETSTVKIQALSVAGLLILAGILFSLPLSSKDRSIQIAGKEPVARPASVAYGTISEQLGRKADSDISRYKASCVRYRGWAKEIAESDHPEDAKVEGLARLMAAARKDDCLIR